MYTKTILPFIFVLVSILFVGCLSIPEIQKGDYVKAISTKVVNLENGTELKLEKKEDVEKTTIFLVRHAEKMKDKKNPDLTSTGEERANRLSKLLENIELDYVFSTDYNRTIQTAQPTANNKSLSIQNYNPRALAEFANTILEDYMGKNVLIVGHSNTTPIMLNLLMDQEVVKSIKESDYENLFIVSVYPKKDPKAVLLKF